MIAPSARLGFCCTFVPEPTPPVTDPRLAREAARVSREKARAMNLTIVTMANLARLSPSEAGAKLEAVVVHNLAALARQIAWVAQRPPLQRLLRLASTVLPGYTHPVAAPLYRAGELRALIESGLAHAGTLARQTGVRLGLHPGPFCILGTVSEAALANAVTELEYHTEVMRLMGYGGGWHPHGAHVNIHVGAREPGLAAFRTHLALLSRDARDLLTVENDEDRFDLDAVLRLADEIPVVLDIHHHWVATRGAYIEPDDPRIARIVESWRGVRPMSHVSVSRETLLPDHDRQQRPDFEALVAAGVRARDLAAHSDMMWNEGVNALVSRHLAWTDFEVEAKGKNLASAGLASAITGAVGESAAAARALK